MKFWYSIFRLSLLFSVTICTAVAQKIVHMNGAYDLDGDNMLEFVALELNPETHVFPTSVRYYEIDSDSYQSLIWEFEPPIELEGYFVDGSLVVDSGDVGSSDSSWGWEAGVSGDDGSSDASWG